ncbi:hypothetical protein RSOLAG22IIIB_05200 [Rhizoctonia solani]|uniref:F-box domain-containing protein n=1 Tax=Rhizoctonia solani TaxID=456999 RepID=A0A0K6G4L5_9AGAM|nr:hypothetical protein RSOLAG22IIIB_05200 [Rhizoctonia solani]
MAPQTRSAMRAVGATTRASSTRSLPSQKVKASKSQTPIQKRKAAPKLKSKPKPEPESEPEPEPARKRARRPDAKRARKDVETLGLKNMPVEVLIEIARYVVPVDLIMLSRVNKFFRELFMDKRSATIWQSALQNLPELPPCPTDANLCEPQYVSMIFLNRCSLCGRYAPREMDPVLLVRFCARCRDRELVDLERVTDPSLVISSKGLVPGKSNQSTLWCLYDEARAVKIKLNELTKAEDQEALNTWKDEQREIVKKRRRVAEPLSKWLKTRAREREEELKRLKATRAAEIGSRLIKLGWERLDFRGFEDCKQWQSMVYNPKPLTEKVWDDILPYLLEHLEVNRNRRLEEERARRFSSRQTELTSWLAQFRMELPPFARASYLEGGALSGSTDNRSASEFVRSMVLYQAFPTVPQIREWAQFKEFTNNDMPHEQFLVVFEEKKHLFEELFATWQRNLEEHLIQLLPNDTRPPDFTSATFNMVAALGRSVGPISTLPEGVSKLLRADAIFSTAPGDGAKLYFYPHHFRDFSGSTHNVYYNSKASEIAQALLGALGLPDASYLALRAEAETFRCGRCPPAVAMRMAGSNW